MIDPTKFEDVIYEVRDRAAWIIINRPKLYKAFCTGGDQSAHEGQYDGRGIVGLPIDELQSIIRDIPKPVIARINGFAIGGGNVFATLCDMSIMSESAKLGQVGPKVGSVNKIVPHEQLDEAVNEWTKTIGERSPTALALAKRSFNADSENIRGISQMALNSVKLFYDTEESKEGVNAFNEKRKPDFHKYVK